VSYYVVLNDAVIEDDLLGIILAFGWLDENHERTYTSWPVQGMQQD